MNTISTKVFSIQATPVQGSAVSESVSPTEAPDLMPGVGELLTTGDPGAMMAALTMQSAHEQAETARQQRDDAAKAQEAAENAAVQDLHDKAGLQREQGWVEGALQIAQGACDCASGMWKAAGAVDKNNPTQARTDGQWATGFGAGASAFKAAQSAADGEFQGAITDKDADEKMHEASADMFKKIADDAHDNEKDAKELLNKALDFYKEYVDAKNQTAMAAIHRA